MLSRRCFVTTSASAGLACALGGIAPTARAQTLAKNARLLVGFPPGGSLDVVASLLVEHVKGYAPSMIVDNRPGAGGRIALETLKAGEPDGSLLALTPGDQITLFPHVYQRLSYDPLRDFVPITTVCTFPFLLAIGPMVPASVTTLAQFIDWCRANPKLATYGSPGAGTRPHFLGVTLARAAGFEFVHLPYKGGAPAMQDLLGGQIPAHQRILQCVSARAIWKPAGTRDHGSATKPAATRRPDGQGGRLSWDGSRRMVRPLRARETPADIVNALHSAVQRALETDAVKSGLAKQSFEVAGMSPNDFARSSRPTWSVGEAS